MNTPQEIAASAAQGFVVLQCCECAENIKRALIAAGCQGQWLEIRPADCSDFMVCISHDGGWETITLNGRHVAIRVGEWVFDNIHPHGMLFDQWLADFDTWSGIEIVSKVDFGA